MYVSFLQDLYLEYQYISVSFCSFIYFFYFTQLFNQLPSSLAICILFERVKILLSPVVKTLPSNAGDEGLIPGWEAKILHGSWPKNIIVTDSIQTLSRSKKKKKNLKKLFAEESTHCWKYLFLVYSHKQQSYSWTHRF